MATAKTPKKHSARRTKAEKARRNRRITRQGIKRPKDTGETLADLRLLTARKPKTAVVEIHAGAKAALKRNNIFVAEAVFQWRRPKRNMVRSDDHILDMAKSVHENGKALPAILVIPLAGMHYVVDGHHRLAAYDTAGWTKEIPASIFHGSLDDAYRVALRSNSKDKLPMGRDDKVNAAWTFVKLGDPRDSKAGIMELTGASKGTVDNMRRVWRQLTDGTHGPLEEVQHLSWPQARRAADGTPDLKDVDDWREQQADKLVIALERAKLAGRLASNPDITALALAKLADDLPALLMAEWAEETERPFHPHDGGDDPEF